MVQHMKNDKTKLTHIDDTGSARMVDVGEKPVSSRGAIAEGRVRISEALAGAISRNEVAKGNLLEVARLAGIQASKKTSDLIPLCHPLGLDCADVECELEGTTISIRAICKLTARTGVEMEALTAVAVTALTVIDMGKAIDRGAVIESIRLVEKWGGRSGHYVAPEQAR